ncbi:MAG TPA: hypothetical protein VFT64_12370 [Rickettsiales bacterium]|nr:hypothetical protein [Rickettsiales bacterium]
MNITISLPGFVPFSNGIKIFHDAALEMSKQGCNVRIIPWDIHYRISDTPSQYQPLYTTRFNSEDSIALLPDSAPPEITYKMRYSHKLTCWWLCNIPGLLGHPAPHFEDTELLVAYSRQISTHLPNFYFHPALTELTDQLTDLRKLPKNNSIVIYTGKGHITPLPPAIRQFCKGKKIIYITRHWPSSKDLLYTLVAKADALISFDPISNLNYEATLLGTPTYLVHALRGSTLNQNFNVPLHGLYVDVAAFLESLTTPFDHERVMHCHYEALAANSQRVHSFLESIKHFTANASPEERKANAVINRLYNEIVPIELRHFRPLLNPTMGGDSENPITIANTAVYIERPELLKPYRCIGRFIFSARHKGYVRTMARRCASRLLRPVIRILRRLH